MELNDRDVPINCANCNILEEGIPAMEKHVAEFHSDDYPTPADVTAYVRLWADSAYEEIDAHNAWRAEEFRRTGRDPEAEEDF